MKSNVKISGTTPLPTNMRRNICACMRKELNKRIKDGRMPTLYGMRSSIKLGFLECEWDSDGINISNNPQFAGIHQFVVFLPKKGIIFEVAIWFD